MSWAHVGLLLGERDRMRGERDRDRNLGEGFLGPGTVINTCGERDLLLE